jgi:hypothetical protein
MRFLVWRNPAILSYSTSTLALRFEGLQRLLGCDAATASRVMTMATLQATTDLDSTSRKLQELTSGGYMLLCALTCAKELCVRAIFHLQHL